MPATEGTTIYLPAVVNHFATEEDNFAWYKVIASHQAGHVEFGSFEFVFDRPCTKFEDIRPRLTQMAGKPPTPMAVDAGERAGRRQAAETMRTATTAARSRAAEDWYGEFGRFFALFPDSRLARDIFAVLEDTRIDYRLAHEYQGLVPLFRAAQVHCLEMRPAIERLPARQALVELMIRLSLQPAAEVQAPKRHLAAALEARRLMEQLRDPTATVEDAAEITIRMYSLICQLHMTQGRAYRSADDVGYRGVFKPELAQLLSRHAGGRAAMEGDRQGSQISLQTIEALLRRSPEVERSPSQMPDQLRWRALVDNVARELAERDQAEQFAPLSSRNDEPGGPLDATEPGAFTYDEWDVNTRGYRPKWCLVRETPMTGADNDFFERTLDSHAMLARQIRRHFELATLEIHRKVKHMQDGEEHDLDDAIEAIIDYRLGKTPSEKLYWRRNKLERSVAVVLLLDMSASTGDAIEPGRGPGSSEKKRIVDVEKEAIVLLLNALSVLDDSYGVYGFSGYGRQNVEFYMVKDLQEEFTPQVAQRIGWISPQYATRMGPAIRHATAKLLQHQARSRFLLMLSDGRPQDRGYSDAGEHRQYAVQDTRMALLEARRQGIVPFCLTVDEGGHSYLKAIMHEMHYEVLSDVSMLPVRLPQLYRKLTT